jgi:hypothetical protein
MDYMKFKPSIRHNSNHAADMMLINLGITKEEEAEAKGLEIEDDSKDTKTTE